MRRTAIIYTAAIGVAGMISGSAIASTVTTADLNMRAGPSTSSNVVTVVPQRSELTIGACVQSAKWCEASFNQMRGWVSSAYLSESQDEAEFPADAEVSDAPIVSDDRSRDERGTDDRGWEDRGWMNSESNWSGDDDEEFPES